MAQDIKISSWLTSLIRFVVLPLFTIVSVILVGMCLLLAVKGSVAGPLLLMPIGSWVIVIYMMVGRAWCAKIVTMTSTGIRICGRTGEIPLDAVVGVRHVAMTLPSMYILHLRSGEMIRFLARRPPGRLEPAIPVARANYPRSSVSSRSSHTRPAELGLSRPTMENKISNWGTPFYRFVVLPIVALIGLAMFGVAVVSLVRGDHNGTLMIVPCIGWFAMIYVTMGRSWEAKSVAMTATGLRVDGRADEIRYADIASVTGAALTSPELITVTTRSGDRIRFLAHFRVRYGWSQHPIVDKLTKKAADAVRSPGSEIDPLLVLPAARVVNRNARR